MWQQFLKALMSGASNSGPGSSSLINSSNTGGQADMMGGGANGGIGMDLTTPNVPASSQGADRTDALLRAIMQKGGGSQVPTSKNALRMEGLKYAQAPDMSQMYAQALNPHPQLRPQAQMQSRPTEQDNPYIRSLLGGL